MSIPDPHPPCHNAPGDDWGVPPRSSSGAAHAMFFRDPGRADSRAASISVPDKRRGRMAGLYFEEFEEGQVFEHAISRTVTEMDNVLFSTLTMNPQPLHLDEEFAKQTE